MTISASLPEQAEQWLKNVAAALAQAGASLSAGLSDPRMQIEIEVTALKQGG